MEELQGYCSAEELFIAWTEIENLLLKSRVGSLKSQDISREGIALQSLLPFVMQRIPSSSEAPRCVMQYRMVHTCSDRRIRGKWDHLDLWSGRVSTVQEATDL